MSDTIWETFDSLFKTLRRQGRRVEELEGRVVELERRLQGHAAPAPALDPTSLFTDPFSHKAKGDVREPRVETVCGVAGTVIVAESEEHVDCPSCLNMLALAAGGGCGALGEEREAHTFDVPESVVEHVLHG
jgi:hypothetical protein